MLEISVLHQHMNMEQKEWTIVVVAMAAVGINVPFQHLPRIAFKMFQIVNGFIQKILVTSKHFKLEVLLCNFAIYRLIVF